MIGYQYVTLRCVPRVEREEFLNVGVVLYAQSVDFLESAHHLDEARLRALAPDLDLGTVEDMLCTVQAVHDRPAQRATLRPLPRPSGRAAPADGAARPAVTRREWSARLTV